VWNRRKFFKLTIAGLISTTGIFSFLQRYKQKNNIVDIVEFPNPILRGVAESIDFIDDSIITLANSMISILRYEAPFAFLFKGSLYKGLAAPQVGIQKRMIVRGLNGEIKILVNPEILENAEKTIGAKNSYAALLEHEIDHLNGVLYIDYA